MTLRLPFGSSYGSRQESRKVSGLLLMKRAFPSRLEIPVHSHESSFFYLALEGAFKETYGGKSRNGVPSMVIFSPAGERHADVWFEGGGCTFTVEFALPNLQGIQERPAALDHPWDYSAGPIVRLAWKLYCEFHKSDAAAPLVMEGLTLEILGESARQDSGQTNHAPPWLARVTELLHDQFHDNLSLAEIASVVRVHPAHLARVFHRHCHCTVGAYLRQLRLEQARRELATSSLSLCDIALAAGYSDQSQITAAFRKHTGLSPAQYRRRARAR
jgi:AraC family transcriptional regulator